MTVQGRHREKKVYRNKVHRTEGEENHGGSEEAADEDDEEPHNEPGISSTTHPIVPVLPLQQGPAASSRGPWANTNSEDEYTEDEDNEYGDVEFGPAIQSARKSRFRKGQ